MACSVRSRFFLMALISFARFYTACLLLVDLTYRLLHNKACYSVNRRWQDGYAKFQEARNVAFEMHELARDEKDPVKEKALRVMGQVAAIPHVKRHALIASDYAVKVINLLYPGNLDEVKKERELQIKLMENI
jgi:hypothetical protein